MSGIFFVLGVAFFVGFLLIFATSFSKKSGGAAPHHLEEGRLPSFERFIRSCVSLAEALKLNVGEVHENADEQSVDLYVENPTPITGGQFIMHCTLRPQQNIVDTAEIVELSNSIIQDRLSKGIFVTTGSFTPDLPTISELAPIEFIDGNRLEELAEKYKIALQTPE